MGTLYSEIIYAWQNIAFSLMSSFVFHYSLVKKCVVTCDLYIFLFVNLIATYYLDVTIVNLYGQNVRIIATVSNPKYQRFTIPTGGRYHINTTTFSNQPVFISSYEDATFKAIKTDGKNSISVTPSLTPVSLVYYVPSGELLANFNPLCVSS